MKSDCKKTLFLLHPRIVLRRDHQSSVIFFIQVPPDRARLRLPLEPDVPRPADPPHRHRQREGRRQGFPEGGGAGHPG